MSIGCAHGAKKIPGMTLALFCLIGFSGCGSRGTDPGQTGSRPGPEREGHRLVTGQWLVVEIDGKPIPEGTTITIDYRPDGELSVETSGKPESVPASDKAKLKQYFDNFEITVIIGGNATLKINEINTLNSFVDGLNVKMRRKA